MRRTGTHTLAAVLITVLALAGCRAALASGPKTSETDSRNEVELFAAAMTAHQRQDNATCRRLLERADSMGSNHPAIILRLAGACALTGEVDRSFDLLERYVAMGVRADLGVEEWFAPLHEDPRFTALASRMAANDLPVALSEVVHTVPERHLVPEGLAVDPVTGDVFLDSLRDERILRISTNGEVAPFCAASADREWKGLGMKVHRPSGRLWVCRDAIDDSTVAGLFAYDLATGRETERILIGDRTRQHFLNDVAVTEVGDLYATDTEAGCLYRKRRDDPGLELYPLELALRHANGIALSADERLLFVAHSMGIVRIDLEQGSATALRAVPTVTLVGVDGLYWYRGDLVAVQNGVTPMRIVRFGLNDAATLATDCTVLERGHPLFAGIPTTGAVAGDRFVYIANCQMRLIDDDGSIPDPDLLQDVVLLGVGL